MISNSLTNVSYSIFNAILDKNLLQPLDEVLALMADEVMENGVFIKSVSFDQFLAAALREEDVDYAIEQI